MKPARKSTTRAAGLVAAAAILYFTAYVLFRLFNTEVWAQDGRAYVIFPTRPIALYYLFRPLTYIDGALTGMRFHIGPHQPV